MKIDKKVIGNLAKCYSVAPLTYHGKEGFLVAAEKIDKCMLFDQDGNHLADVWDEPGGVMTMVQMPGHDGEFLATHKFYSPNDSKEAKIVVASPLEDGTWKIHTLAELPFVHRFDILQRNGVTYILACTLKSGHQQKDDWSMPGKVYAGVLPDDLSVFSEENPLKLEVIKEDMLKNHGYYRICEDGIESGLVSSENGVFQFIPPAHEGGDWEIHQLISDPASDGVLIDLDQDGEKELVVITPFHGDTIRIYKKQDGSYQQVFEFEEKTEFLHSIFGGDICGRPTVIMGHRKGKRNLMMIRYDSEKAAYVRENIDEDCGSANVYHFVKEGKDIVISTNREIDEIAMYTITE